MLGNTLSVRQRGQIRPNTKVQGTGREMDCVNALSSEGMIPAKGIGINGWVECKMPQGGLCRSLLRSIRPEHRFVEQAMERLMK